MSPRLDPTSWATLGVADSLTTLTMSSKQPTFDLLKCHLKRPKHQSGENLVWPTGKNDILMSSCRPHETLYIM